MKEENKRKRADMASFSFVAKKLKHRPTLRRGRPTVEET
jgi:hypothetical protein